MIEFSNLSFAYSPERKPTISDFSASFESDRISVLTGPSGCGKSTLLYLAAGIYPKYAGLIRSGSVTVSGKNPAAIPPEARCRLVGMMFQNPDLQFCMDTVRNELIFCLENIAAEPSEIESKLQAALEFCDITHLEHRSLNTLSGGEKQKVMLACLAAIGPKWLLLDEPFANIDDASAKAIAAKLKQLHDMRGTGILIVDHRLDHWLGIADDIRVFRDGKIIDETIDPHSSAQLERLGVIAPNTSYHPDIPPAKPGKTVLEIKSLCLKHGDRMILHNLSAAFQSGMIYAILGESGCGKSSLFGALSGIYRHSGEILLEGTPLRKLKRSEIGHIGFVTQSPQDQFVTDTVRKELMQSLRGSSNAEAESERILRAIGLWAYRDVSPYILSQGQQRRLGVAALTAYDCKILICDEPTYAQDRKNTLELMGALCRTARERNTALVFSTHDRRLAADYADKILLLEGGQLHEEN
ncbi:MAG: ABC transporter ATP-binding protein [Clostridia bacterium]|nr:ABC transporter ATP-binding protein [Clostridia bacterium]